MSNRKTTEEVIASFEKAHKNSLIKYDYSKVVYTYATEKVIIGCPIHGDFEDLANHHSTGKGCSKCSDVKGGKKRTIKQTDLIKRFDEKHSNKYDYSLVVYTIMKDKITIICPNHGMFEQTPDNHVQGQGCPKCGLESARYKMYKDKRTILYYIRIGDVYKIGVTKSSVKDRFRKDDIVYEIIAEKIFDDGIEALQMEQGIIQMYSKDRYQGIPVIKVGHTECFSTDILKDYYE